MRTFQRSFLRAGLHIKHTEGFNPHAFVSIPLPLSVGFSSGCEVLECEILNEEHLERVPERMNAALPTGITVSRCYEAVRPVKELCYVNYIVTMEYEAGAPFGAERAIHDLLDRDALVVTKRSKKAKSGQVELDLIPLIAKATVEERRDTVTLDLILRAQNPGCEPGAHRLRDPRQLSGGRARFCGDLPAQRTGRAVPALGIRKRTCKRTSVFSIVPTIRCQ